MITLRVFFLLTLLFVITSQLDAVTQEDLEKIENIVDEDVFKKINEILDETQKSEDKEQKIESFVPRLFGKRDEDEQLGMDTLTIIWYLTTFTALFGFFLVMACTDNTCNRRRSSKPVEIVPVPSPCPSYKHFAPPSYGSVMKKLKEQKIYIVPVHESNNNFFNHPMNDAVSSTNSNRDIEKNETIKK